jgi:hypothetical protein
MPASLRSGGVRVHPGIPFGFRPKPAFGFAGILSRNLSPTQQAYRVDTEEPIVAEDGEIVGISTLSTYFPDADSAQNYRPQKIANDKFTVGPSRVRRCVGAGPFLRPIRVIMVLCPQECV